MSRKGAGGRGVQECAGWPVEWTCAGIVILAVLVFSQANRFAPSFLVGQCTSLSGMCTPSRCSCSPPQRKRELVTQDAQACYQCVAEFCPAVSEGDLTCTTASCECDDPTWPKVEIQVDGQSCWQCVRPSLDFTARVGPGDDSCLAVAPAVVPQVFTTLGEETPAAARTSVVRPTVNSAQRLIHTTNRSKCAPFRYNGARITDKHSNHTCLAWSVFGEHWGLVECDLRDPLMQFKQLAIPEAPTPTQEIYCSGENASEYCIEVAEVLCTEEDGRCSTESCRCEDPGWTRQELHMHNGSECYSCTPPPTHCETSQDTCTSGPCECADPSHLKVQADRDGEGPEDNLLQPPCFRCMPPSSGGSEVSMLSTVLLVIMASLLGGCFVRRLRDPAANPSPPGKKHSKRHLAQAVDGPRSWAERWAAELEDSIEGLYEAFVENPAMCIRWLRPHLRQVLRKLGDLLDMCDLALEPVYCVVDVVQAWAWDSLVVQHERLVAAVNWVCDKYSDFMQLVSRQRGNSTAGAVKAKGRRSRTREDSRDPFAEGDTGILSSKQKARAAKQLRPDADSHKLHQENGLTRQDSEHREGSIGPPDNLTWDPLGVVGGAGPTGQDAPVPEECVRRLVGAAQPRGQPVSPQTPNPSARPTPVQLRAQRKLQQRREALQQQQQRQQQQQQQRHGPLVTGPQPETQAEPSLPIDESWIDELEREESKAKAAGKKASKTHRRKQAAPGKETTAVETPPRAESAGPAGHQEPVRLEEAAAIAAAAKAQEEREPEDPLDLFDPERLLGEAMHGIFMLVKGQLRDHEAEGEETEEKETGEGKQQLEAELEEEGEEAEQEVEQEAEGQEEEIEEEVQEEEDEEAEEEEGEEEECEEAEAEEAEEEEEEEAEEELEEAEEEESALDAEVDKQGEAEDCDHSVEAEEGPAATSEALLGQATEEQPASEVVEEDEPVLSAKQRKRRAKVAAAAAAAATPVSPFPGRVTTPAGGHAASPSAVAAVRSKEPVTGAPQRPLGHRPELHPRSEGAKSVRPVEPAAGPPPAPLSKAPARALSKAAPMAARRHVMQPRPVVLPPAGSPAAQKPTDGSQPRAWASVVAGWAKRDESNNEPREADALSDCQPEARPGSALGGVEAPEFVPLAMQKPLEDTTNRPFKQRQRKASKLSGRSGRPQEALDDVLSEVQGQGQGDYDDTFAGVVTTVMATGLDPKLTQEEFMMQLDSWGLIGTYDFLHMPMDEHTQLSAGCVFINFIDPAFVLLFCWIYHEFQFEGAVTPAEVQGVEANCAMWKDATPEPAIVPSPAPSQWSVNTVNAMLSPQFREQFRKTKMCAFYKKGRCEMGAGCPFAHSPAELLPAPDLAKTKLCFNYFRGRCNDPRCKFAHGSQELRSVWVPYSPGVWFFGSEDASGNQCYSPQDSDLQTMDCMAGAVVGYPLMEQHLNGFLHGGEAPVLGELPPVVQDPPDEYMEIDENQEPMTHYGATGYDMGDGIALRVRGTFMEVMRLTDTPMMKRSLSEGDVEAFCKGMEEADV